MFANRLHLLMVLLFGFYKSMLLLTPVECIALALSLLRTVQPALVPFTTAVSTEWTRKMIPATRRFCHFLTEKHATPNQLMQLNDVDFSFSFCLVLAWNYHRIIKVSFWITRVMLLIWLKGFCKWGMFWGRYSAPPYSQAVWKCTICVDP